MKTEAISKLDRLLLPHLTSILQNGNLEEVYESVYHRDFDGIEVKSDLSEWTVEMVLVNDEQVYRRTDEGNKGVMRTVVLRPGSWIDRLVELGREYTAREEDAEIDRALGEAVRTYPNFKPI